MRVQAANTQSLLCACALFWSSTSSIVNGFSAPTEVSVKRLPVGRISTLDRSKLNPGKDSDFYDNPNMVTHADDQFISKVADLYSDLLPRNGVILDIMSSHVSHLPELLPLQRVDLHGMNGKELEANPSRDQTRGSFMVRDFNEIPSLLGFGETAMYDAVLCCCSVQYLEKPEEVFAKVARTLKPGGKVIVTFTNRFFPQKATIVLSSLRGSLLAFLSVCVLLDCRWYTAYCTHLAN